MLTLLLAACALTGTDDSQTIVDAEGCDATDAIGWSEASHAKGIEGQADIVFPEDDVPRMDIVICASAYQAMQDELEDFYGGEDSNTGGPPGGGGGGGGGGAPSMSFETPPYQSANVAFGDQTWPSVGIRYKGNSSLAQGYQDGSGKLPFRLEFDHFEDDVAAVEDQRFWGFKELKFSSAFADDSMIKDKLASDTFRDAGIPAARSGFVQVYVDTGDGPVFWGVYTMFEDPSGEMLDDWFGTDAGNAYKPDGTAAALGDFDQDHFDKKTNEDDADWSDVEAFIDILNENTHDAAWRADLEAHFEVDAFLQYLALNNLIENWDSYGNMTHNYYLYGDPALNGRLVWIPWDFNMSYGWSAQMEPLSLDMDEVGDDWPLIRNLMDQGTYEAAYQAHMEDVLEGAFSVETQTARINAYHDLIAPYAVLESEAYTNQSSATAFEDSAQDLIDHVQDRHDAAEQYLR